MKPSAPNALPLLLFVLAGCPAAPGAGSARGHSPGLASPPASSLASALPGATPASGLSRAPAPSGPVVLPEEQALLNAALALIDDPEAAHAKANELPPDCPLRRSNDFARIENTWADSVLKSGDVPALRKVAAASEVADDRRDRASMLLDRRDKCQATRPAPASSSAPLQPSPLVLAKEYPPNVIQRAVLEKAVFFRNCYANALRRGPPLHGMVRVGFVINSEGETTCVEDNGSDLPNRGAVQCVLREFRKLTFPKPDKGIVTVVYPIQFSPGG